MTPVVLTVSQVNFFLKSLIEGDGRLNNVTVTGEISNFTDHYRSGHLYFSLKDEKSVLKAVMFSTAAGRLKFRPENGMKVIVRGRVSVYEASGQYQLYAEDMQPDGVGALTIAYEQLKARLEREGLFDEERKRPLPRYPMRIGVITSPTGAAVQDILQVTNRRWPAAEIVFCPVLVQGEGAPAQLVAALKAMNSQNACDVIIIGRGGGSLEDLWAFNDEAVARAVYGSSIPVVSAVGHETDFTICDFAADVRAPTPSAAAELVTPDIREVKENCLAFSDYFREKAVDMVQYYRQSLDLLTRDSPLANPERLLEGWKQNLALLFGRFCGAYEEALSDHKRRLALLSGRLDDMSPLKVLARGYSVVKDKRGRVVSDSQEISAGEAVVLQFHRGQAEAEIKTIKEDGKDGTEAEI